MALQWKPRTFWENATDKLRRKHADMIVANSLRTAGAGFGTDTNVTTILTEDGRTELGLLSKEETANRILNEILSRLSRENS